MAVVFFLGPGIWDPAKRPVTEPNPLSIRRKLAKILRGNGHRVIIMEDVSDRAGEDLINKFDRLLRNKVTDVVFYWPPKAKMQTTYDEFILLCDRADVLKKSSMGLWALHHSSVATIAKGEFKVLEVGSRSRYRTAVARLGVRPLEWNGDDELFELAKRLSREL